MANAIEKPKKNLGESIRQRLKNLSEKRNRPFDEILRYYAMERFLYRLSISLYAKKFFLKGGLMLKVWNSMDHRATMDIDLLARTPNQIDNLQRIITEVAGIPCEEDGIAFDTQKLILRNTQTAGDYNGISSSFSAKLFTTNMPVLIDIGAYEPYQYIHGIVEPLIRDLVARQKIAHFVRFLRPARAEDAHAFKGRPVIAVQSSRRSSRTG